MNNSLNAKEKLNRLNKMTVFFSVLDIVITLWAIIGLLKAISIDDGRLTLFYVGLAAVAIVCSAVFASRISRKRSLYTKELQEESARIVRSGIWAEIWEDYNHDGFEFRIRYDRLLYEEAGENSIDFSFSANGHEFFVLVDEKEVSVIADEETDYCTEAVIQLCSIQELDTFYESINSFVESVCGSKDMQSGEH